MGDGQNLEAVRLPIVAVIGSGSPHHPSARLAAELGALVARKHCHLLTGGGGGVMFDASRGFTAVGARSGLAIGVIPRAASGDGPKPGYPNEHVEVPIYTHLAGADPTSVQSRNPINVLTCCCVVALPGDAGTRAEARLALRYGTPIRAVIDVGAAPSSTLFEKTMTAMGVACVHVEMRPGKNADFDLGSVEAFINGSPVRPCDTVSVSRTSPTVGEHAARFDRP